MRIIEMYINAKHILSILTKTGSSPFLIFRCFPLDTVNRVYCLVILSIYIIYVSGKLGRGGVILEN